MPKIHLASWQLSLITAAFLVAANSESFFVSLIPFIDLPSISGVWLLFTIALTMVLVLATLIHVVAAGHLEKPLIAIFLVSSSVFGYFTNHMGIAFDKNMFRNISQTMIDRNMAEAMELLSLPLVEHILIYGVIPALLLSFVIVSRRSLIYEVGTRFCMLIIGAAFFSGTVLPQYKEFAFLAVEHRDLRYKIVPIYPIVTIVRLIGDGLHDSRPFQFIETDAVRHRTTQRRTIGIMVVGETARADHFSLLGYDKQTNPNLESTKDILFAHGNSCSTSTILSVPCMFSMRGQGNFSPETVQWESNVLDILKTAGVQIAWVDNNSGCHHVCDRVDYVNLRGRLDDSSPYYNEYGFYDEALLQFVDDYLERSDFDILLILHMLGSHGPAYSHRYPPEFGRFSPYCDKLSPKECSSEEVSNAYDNTILYTDYILKELIRRLQSRQDNADVFLMYASDHGESLGEHGLYLHGMPYRIAPAAQTDVPFVIWFSRAFREHHRIDDHAARKIERARLSHDNISHTLLGLFDVEASSYERGQDIFARRTGKPASNIRTGEIETSVEASD